jgi:hypothetical protein
MKRKIKLIGVIAIAALITFSFISCGDSDSNTHEHQWGAWTQTRAATCTVEGEDTRVCALDAKHKETRPVDINPQAHNWSAWRQNKDPNYIEDGEETRNCSNNAAHVETRKIEKLIIPPFYSVADFDNWLKSQPIMWQVEPYIIKLNVNDISTLKATLDSEPLKYVFLDMSDSAITAFPDYAFTTSYQGCATLYGINLPNTTVSIGEGAFYNCRNLNSVTIPSGVKSIGDLAFFVCGKLVNVTIPDGVTSIGEGAFGGCSFTSIIIPNSVTSIGRNGFSGCIYLASVTIPDSITSIEKDAFSICYKLASVIIPNSVTSIGERAFYFCSVLPAITIPESVTSIGINAFKDCTSLTRVTFAGTIPSSGFALGTAENPTFPGDLRARFYSSDRENGTPGTYTRSNGTSTTWRRQ